MNNFKALTPESKTVSDMKEVTPKAFEEFSGISMHTDIYCLEHFTDRIKNYCENYSLLDVLLSGTGLDFIHIANDNLNCKCGKKATNGIRRIG
jgi:hypothetical protein